MATFVMFGRYSSEALDEISAERTARVVGLIKKFGGEIISMYALLGDQDLLLLVNLPDVEQAVKASVALNKLTGISFSTSLAVPVEEFDRMVNDL